AGASAAVAAAVTTAAAAVAALASAVAALASFAAAVAADATASAVAFAAVAAGARATCDVAALADPGFEMRLVDRAGALRGALQEARGDEADRERTAQEDGRLPAREALHFVRQVARIVLTQVARSVGNLVAQHLDVLREVALVFV